MHHCSTRRLNGTTSKSKHHQDKDLRKWAVLLYEYKQAAVPRLSPGWHMKRTSKRLYEFSTTLWSKPEPVEHTHKESRYSIKRRFSATRFRNILHASSELHYRRETEWGRKLSKYTQYSCNDAEDSMKSENGIYPSKSHHTLSDNHEEHAKSDIRTKSKKENHPGGHT